MWSCGSDKAPDPNGYNFSFIKSYWFLFKNYIFAVVKEFFDRFMIPSGCNSSFITLILKVYSPILVTDFRPISLLRVQ